MAEIEKLIDEPGFQPLTERLMEAAKSFTSEEATYGQILRDMVMDIEKAFAEPLEIFPVCHHSRASALFMVERLQRSQPKVIFMEMCEDFRPLVNDLRECKLPVAFQAFATESEAFPKQWAPLSVIAPLTEFSAEFQAIAFCLNNPDTELVFVDRSVDHVFQWTPKEEENPQKPVPSQKKDSNTNEHDEKAMHGSSVGIQVGSMIPTYDEFLVHLLLHANVRHYSEWWDQYVETPLVGKDYRSYRQVMFLIASLMRRLGTKKSDNEDNKQRERYMWTRMKNHLKEKNLEANKAIYICGAYHAVSDVEDFGINSPVTFEISEKTNTEWLYGMIPSGYSAIEYQFGLADGTITLAETGWKKSLKSLGLSSFKLSKNKKQKKKITPKTKSLLKAEKDQVLEYLTKAPAIMEGDQEQLLNWSTEIVRMARKNGYLASTADSISVYETSIMLANIRNRHHPSPYDFQDAAVTCLEKDFVPKKRNIKRICEIMMGGDLIGTVGYQSLPPLAQNVYDRLEPLKVNLTAKTIQRALIDFKRDPNLIPCSDVLWKLRYLIPFDVVRPIMGERVLGVKPIQESWDILIGKHQRYLIELGYEGVNIEQVLTLRLKKAVYSNDTNTVKALEACKDSILFLGSPRFTTELGQRAVELLSQEEGADSSPEIFRLARELTHYYRTTEEGLPDWIKDFVSTGYSHYSTMLPAAFNDRGVSPAEISAMLGFIFTMESLALSFGCSRDQLLIAIKQSSPAAEDAPKMALFWTAECVLSLKTLEDLRDFFDHVLESRLLLSSFPHYLSGFLLTLSFTQIAGPFIVELMSKAFGTLPDSVLFRWMPTLIMMLKEQGTDLMRKLIKEANFEFPPVLADLDNSRFSWEKTDGEKPKSSVQAETNL